MSFKASCAVTHLFKLLFLSSVLISSSYFPFLCRHWQNRQKSEVLKSALYSLTVAVLLLLFLWQRLIFTVGPERHHSGLTIPTTIDQDDFQKVLVESAGFFDDMHQGDWQRLKERMRATPDCGTDCAPAGPQEWHQTNWEPAFTCQHERCVSRWGDGGKWVCDPYRITKNKPSCLVYSVGSENDFSFEEGVWLDVSPECEIHTFDPTIGEEPSNLPAGNIQFHPWGLAGQDNGTSKTLPTIINELGHTGREIDIFKIDCEGCEWDTYKGWFDGATTIRQIQIELHGGTEEEPPISAQSFHGVFEE